jgi:UDP-glucose 4-epimerase
MNNKILVVGGAGYIGSHAILALLDASYSDIAIFDNFARGHRDSFHEIPIFDGDLRNFDDISFAIRQFSPDVIMHFAALAYVDESVKDPESYYLNNVVGTLNLLRAMNQSGVKKLVFSSTCTVYGDVEHLPIFESNTKNPINAYGKTKLASEFAIQDYCLAYNFSSVILRYFNAAGADKLARASERHNPETHLIPLVLQEALRTKLGGDPEMSDLSIFGNDYPTKDGTCIRDYVHVSDIGDAHILAAQKLLESKSSIIETYNLGSGMGYSVMDVINTARRLTKEPIIFLNNTRRQGDPAALVAGSSEAKLGLKWNPKFQDLDVIVETAWDALLKLQNGER